MKNKSYIILSLVTVMFCACEKELKINYEELPRKQVLISNFYPTGNFQVSLSDSKSPGDYSSVNFLENATVDLYEDGVFIETLPYVYRDSAYDYGFFTSVYKAVAGKTYTIKTSGAEGLPGVSATEYLPETLPVHSFWLEQHPDASDPNRKGIITFDIEDNGLLADHYFASVFYYVVRPRIRDNGDTTWVEDAVYNLSPLSSPEFPNPSQDWRVYFTDQLFNGTTKHFTFEFPGLYNSYYREITLIFELSHTGKNYFDYYSAFVSKNSSNLSNGFSEPVSGISNIENGYGHFSGINSSYVALRIK